MGINAYNSNQEERYSDVIKLLKNLPEEQAPPDFEFRLMTKIENGNYELNSPKDKSGFPVWVFAPATAVVLSAIVFFVIFDSVQFNNNGPLFPEPKLRAEVNEKAPKAKEYISKSSVPAVGNSEAVKVIVEPNDVVVTRKVTPPQFTPGKAVNLDNIFANGKIKGGTKLSGPNRLVGNSSDPYFEFDGFYPVRENGDSLKKVKSKIDSMKKVRQQRLN